MRNLNLLNDYRDRDVEINVMGVFGDDSCGVFRFPLPGVASKANVIASALGGWDHVSVTLPNRCPTWGEMDLIKRAFFEPDECALQYHPPVAKHVNVHPFCLHLWRPHLVPIPMPPQEFV